MTDKLYSENMELTVKKLSKNMHRCYQKVAAQTLLKLKQF